MQAVMFEKFELKFVRPREGRALIVGSKVYHTREDRRKHYANVVGVDMLPGEGVDRVVDMEGELPEDFGMFDHVECLSVLEHSRKPWFMAKNIMAVMNPKATLFLTVPFVWRVHAYPADYWRFTIQAVKEIFDGIEWEILCYAHAGLSKDFRVPQTIIDDHIYFVRTEVYGFGWRSK